MAYGTLARVKELLGITDTSEDTELTNHIASADAEIDSELARANLSVPSPTPTLIAEASSYLASAKQRRERIGDPRLIDFYRSEGDRLLMKYVHEKISGGGVSGVSRENLS